MQRPPFAIKISAKSCSARAYVSDNGRTVRLFMAGKEHGVITVPCLDRAGQCVTVARWIAACAKVDAAYPPRRRRRSA